MNSLQISAFSAKFCNFSTGALGLWRGVVPRIAVRRAERATAPLPAICVGNAVYYSRLLLIRLFAVQTQKKTLAVEKKKVENKIQKEIQEKFQNRIQMERSIWSSYIHPGLFWFFRDFAQSTISLSNSAYLRWISQKDSEGVRFLKGKDTPKRKNMLKKRRFS